MKEGFSTDSLGIDIIVEYTYNVFMKSIEFTWDDQKNKSNQKKHGVRFEEAQTVFYDARAVQFFDPDHSENEDRFILLGLSVRMNILIVCHCYREKDWLVRIISARKADKNERKHYGR